MAEIILDRNGVSSPTIQGADVAAFFPAGNTGAGATTRVDGYCIVNFCETSVDFTITQSTGHTFNDFVEVDGNSSVTLNSDNGLDFHIAPKSFVRFELVAAVGASADSLTVQYVPVMGHTTAPISGTKPNFLFASRYTA